MSDNPIFEGLLEKYAREESEALIAYRTHDLIDGLEGLLREASEG